MKIDEVIRPVKVNKAPLKTHSYSNSELKKLKGEPNDHNYEDVMELSHLLNLEYDHAKKLLATIDELPLLYIWVKQDIISKNQFRTIIKWLRDNGRIK